MTLLETSTLVLVSWVVYRLENLGERLKSVERKVFSKEYSEERRNEEVPLSLGKEYVELREVKHGKRRGYTILRKDNRTKYLPTGEQDL